MPEKARYIDADKLIRDLYSAIPYAGGSYSSDPLSIAVNQVVSQSIQSAFTTFIGNLQGIIDRSAVPYDKCMLCVQRDACIPEHPLGENR